MTGTDQDSPPALRSATPATPVRHRVRLRVRVGTTASRLGRATQAAGRATRRWAARPGGRFALPALTVIALLILAATAGGYVVPATAPEARAPLPSPSADLDPGTEPNAPGGLDPSAEPLPGSSGGTGDAPTANSRPADTLTNWAVKLSPTLGIPVVALKAYGYAQLWSQQSQPSCHLTWTTLAGIGKVESDHGQAGGSTLQPDGRAIPAIVGPVLDGSGGRARIVDHDQGRFDGDTAYDHAVGPMQFLPGTWEQYQIDADQDGVADPNDINDAALAAADDLCADGRDLSVPLSWWAAIQTYNAPLSYAQDVFNAANDYGVRSRTVT